MRFWGRLCCVVLCLAVLPLSGCRTGDTAATDGTDGGRGAGEPVGGTEEVTLAGRLLAGLTAARERIELTGICGGSPTEEAVRAVYSRLLASQPALFYVMPTYTVGWSAGGRVRYLLPEYRYTGAALDTARRDFDRRLDRILLPAKQMDDEAAVAYLHDAVIARYAYDTTLTVYDPYTMLTGGSGVCQAYSLLLTALCRRRGIQADCVLCFEGEHQWVRVTLPGGRYHIDPVGDEAATGDTGQVSRLWFCLSDEEMRAMRRERGVPAEWEIFDPWETAE